MAESAKQKFVFVNRRKGVDRRYEQDPCKNMDIDLFHRKRRKSTERRDLSKTILDDYYAFVQANASVVGEKKKRKNEN